MRVALASCTARVVKLSATDRSLSLMGRLGVIHNLDVVMPSGDDLFPALQPEGLAAGGLRALASSRNAASVQTESTGDGT